MSSVQILLKGKKEDTRILFETPIPTENSKSKVTKTKTPFRLHCNYISTSDGQLE